MIYRRQHLCGVGNDEVCVASSIQVCVTIRRKCYLLIIELPTVHQPCIFMMYTVYHFQMLKSTGQASGNKGSMQQQAEEGQVHLSHVNVVAKEDHCNKTSLVWILAHVDSAAVWVENFVGGKCHNTSPRLTTKTRNKTMYKN